MPSSLRRPTGVYALPQLNSSAETFASLPPYSLTAQGRERTVSPEDMAAFEAARAQGPQGSSAHVQPRPSVSLQAPTTPPASPSAVAKAPPQSVENGAGPSMPRSERPQTPSVAARSPSPIAPANDKPARNAAPVHIGEINRSLGPDALAAQIARWRIVGANQIVPLAITQEQHEYLRKAIDACQDRHLMSGFLHLEPPTGTAELLSELVRTFERVACHHASAVVPGLFDADDLAKVLRWRLCEVPELDELCSPRGERRKRYEKLMSAFTPLIRSAIVSDDPIVRQRLVGVMGRYFDKLVERADNGDERRLRHHVRRLEPQWINGLVHHLGDSAGRPSATQSDVRRLWLKDFAQLRLRASTALVLQRAFSVLVNLEQRQANDPNRSRAQGWERRDGFIVTPLLTLLATLQASAD